MGVEFGAGVPVAPAVPAGDARWTSDRVWVYDLRQVLAAGSRCTLRASTAFQPLGGALEGRARRQSQCAVWHRSGRHV